MIGFSPRLAELKKGRGGTAPVPSRLRAHEKGSRSRLGLSKGGTRRAILLGGLLAALCGCVSYQKQPLSADESARMLDQRRLDDPGLRQFIETTSHTNLAVWPLPAWDFTHLTWAALYFHPSLALARAQLGVGQAEVLTAQGRLNPVLSVVPGYNTSSPSAVSPWLPGVSLDIPIETAGKRGYRTSLATHHTESLRYNLTTTAWQIRGQLRATLLELTATARREELFQQQMAAHNTIVRLLEQRLAVGAIARPELTPASILREQALIELRLAHAQNLDARVRVAEAIGVPARALDGLKLVFDLSAQTLPVRASWAEARRQALQTRSDILAALADYEATQSALQLEIAKQYPNIHLSPGYQYDQGENKWSLGVSVELPVLNQNQGPIAEAQARRRESAARFTALQSKVIADIDRALTAYLNAQQQIEDTTAILASQRQQLAAVQAQVDVGALDQLDLASAQLAVNVGELARLDRLLALQQAFGALEESLQLDTGLLPNG